MGYSVALLLRDLIPTVLVRLRTDEGEVAFRARWKRSAAELHRRILFCLREGRLLWFEDERGHTRCFDPECVWRVVVDGRHPGGKAKWVTGVPWGSCGAAEGRGKKRARRTRSSPEAPPEHR